MSVLARARACTAGPTPADPLFPANAERHRNTASQGERAKKGGSLRQLLHPLQALARPRPDRRAR
eukprot:10317137-Alexandrium_andersonii.AAC.1